MSFKGIKGAVKTPSLRTFIYIYIEVNPIFVCLYVVKVLFHTFIPLFTVAICVDSSSTIMLVVYGGDIVRFFNLKKQRIAFFYFVLWSVLVDDVIMGNFFFAEIFFRNVLLKNFFSQFFSKIFRTFFPKFFSEKC